MHMRRTVVIAGSICLLLLALVALPWLMRSGNVGDAGSLITIASPGEAMNGRQPSSIEEPRMAVLAGSEKLTAQLRSEGRDRVWAPEAEKQLKSIFSQSDSGVPEDRLAVECARVLCAVAGEITAPFDPREAARLIHTIQDTTNRASSERSDFTQRATVSFVASPTNRGQVIFTTFLRRK